MGRCPSKTVGSAKSTATGDVRAGTATTEYRFTGQHYDAHLGFIYLRARYYDPTTGRFVSKDPFPGVLTIPTSQHPYTYVLNNPVNGTDPSGELLPAIVIGGLVIGADIYVPVAVAAAAIATYQLQQNQDEIAALANQCIADLRDLTAKDPPNPGGSRGKAPHREKIEETIKELEKQGFEHVGGGNKPEVTIDTKGGHKSRRRADITMRDPNTGELQHTNVGRTTKTGEPISRERKALDDIERATGVRPRFIPYDR